MLHVYEFEVYKGEKYLIAEPFDLPGATQGVDMADIAESAVDWLQMEMEHRAMHELPFPKATFGNKLRHGGERLVVAVQAGKETVPRMTAAAAARELGVTAGRVSQMIKADRLETFEFEGRTWVTRASVEARKAEAPKAGRPKKEAISA